MQFHKRLLRPSYFVFVIAVSVLPASGSGPGTGEAVAVPNMFAVVACTPPLDPDFCPGGVWDQAAFDQMFQDPPAFPSHYPSGQTGSYARAVVPLCEEESCVEDIRCTDGTRPVFFFDPGGGADADKWIINIQNGGDDCTSVSCFTEYALGGGRNDFSSAYGQVGDRKNAGGTMSANGRNLFRDYNRILIDKCVGDRNLGDATLPDVDYAPGVMPQITGPLYFHGFRIIKGVLQALKDLPGGLPDLQDAEQVAFQTHSNGSNGGYLYMDRLADYVRTEIAAPGNQPDVRFLASSGHKPTPEVEYALLPVNDSPGTPAVPPGGGMYPVGPVSYLDFFGHVDDVTTSSVVCGEVFDPANPSYIDWMDNGRTPDGSSTCQHGVGNDHLRGIGGMFFSPADYVSGIEFTSLLDWGANDATPTTDASCVAAHLPSGDVVACNDSRHVMVYHLTTPTFHSMQTGDRVTRKSPGGKWTVTFDPAQCDAGDPNCHSENFRGEVNGDGEEVPSVGAWHREGLRVRELLIADELFAGTSPHHEAVGPVAHGGFVNNTVDHDNNQAFSKTRRTMKAAPQARPREMQDYLRQWLDPDNVEPVICVDDAEQYDADLAPPVPFADVPPGLECDTGFYQSANPDLTDDQTCLDPYANIAIAAYSCPEVDSIFADGFESGDLSNRSAVVP